MPYRENVGLVLAKIESVYGTDPTPAAAANSIRVLNPAVYEADAEYIERKILDGTGDAIPSEVRQTRARMTFTVEISGNRTDGSTPDISAGSASYALALSPLLRACDMAEDYDAESSGGARDGSVLYTPTVPSAEGSSLTLYLYKAGKVHKITGAKGTFTITCQAGDFWRINFEFRGKYVAVSDASIPSGSVFEATVPPKWGNTSGALLNSTARVMSQVTFTLGNNIELRPDANLDEGVKGYLVTQRQSVIEFDPEDETEATLGLFTAWKAGTVQTLDLINGTETGNTIQLLCYGQITNIRDGSRAGLVTKQVSMRTVRSSISASAGYDVQLKFF